MQRQRLSNQHEVVPFSFQCQRLMHLLLHSKISPCLPFLNKIKFISSMKNTYEDLPTPSGLWGSCFDWCCSFALVLGLVSGLVVVTFLRVTIGLPSNPTFSFTISGEGVPRDGSWSMLIRKVEGSLLVRKSRAWS